MSAPATPPPPHRLYLDSSALVARYFVEPHTTTAQAAITGAAALASSYAAYPESRSALARITRDKHLSRRDHRLIVQELAADWLYFERLVLDERVSNAAGSLAPRHKLKGFDAVHLASALAFHRLPGGIVFLSYDGALNRAAQEEGLTLWTP